MDHDHCDHPSFRATICADGSIWLAHWEPWLDEDIPWHTLVAAQPRPRRCLLDIALLREHDHAVEPPELIVAPLTEFQPAHREALITWARTVGYRRVWLGDEVLELEPTSGGSAESRCRVCGNRMVGKGTDFWSRVRRSGCFPRRCLVCGCEIPQWQHVEQREVADPRPRVRTSVGGRQPRQHDSDRE